jgi:hypothetical protein
MTNVIFIEGPMDIPADDDTSRRSVLSEVVTALTNQLRGLTGRSDAGEASLDGADHETDLNGTSLNGAGLNGAALNGKSCAAKVPTLRAPGLAHAKDSCATRPTTGPIIRPSPHQKVAIDVHRDDWP